MYLEGQWDTEGGMGREETLMLAAWGWQCHYEGMLKTGVHEEGSESTGE